MLRIGRKYQFEAFVADAQSRLRECYPKTLAQFRQSHSLRSIGFRTFSELLEVVHESILPDDILPALYYENLRHIVSI